MRARHAARATSIERIKNTRIHSRRRFRRHRSRKTRFRLDSIIPILAAYLPSSADTIETIDRMSGNDAARETRRRRATRGDAPGDGGGRELRGRGHGWRESSTSADEVLGLGLGLGRDDDRPTARPTDALARFSSRAGMAAISYVYERLEYECVRGRGRDDPCPTRLSSDTRYIL